ncbi:MAG TPA: cation:proton antiporter [bacterium]|nr:cation:proton antiporter [bacterium]HQL62388.1 cation:proton antiporter [bacterium]
MTQEEIMVLFLALAMLLGTARLLGELAMRIRQPAIMGEILAGILLGPTVLGVVAPEWSRYLFPTDGNFPTALEGLTTLSITLFLLVAGMEVDLSTVFRQGKAAFHVGITGLTIPFAVGFAVGWFFPGMSGAEEGSDRLVFALFLATAMSITALPVIAKILIDLNLFRSDLGMIIVASAILHDLIGWNIFALILGMMRGAGNVSQVGISIGLTLLFVVVMLTVGRRLLDRLLPWIQAHASWPGGVLGFMLTGGFLCAAFTEMIGTHAIFGAFIFGVALGDSSHLRAHVRSIMDQFISFIFAPIFFASIGLQVDFAANFDLLLVLVILTVGTAAKVGGCALGARLSGIKPRESLAIGVAMNARGAMEIILGLLAMKAGLINQRLFVALVVMALFTSMTSGSMMHAILKRRRPIRFMDFLTGRRFTPVLNALDRRQAIRELTQLACAGTDIPPEAAFDAVWQREQIMSTSLDHGVAVPHARMENLKTPIVALGISGKGVDFDSTDGQPTHLIFLLLTPSDDHRVQLELLADIGQAFQDPALIQHCVTVRTFTEFLALFKSYHVQRAQNGE